MCANNVIQRNPWFLHNRVRGSRTTNASSPSPTPSSTIQRSSTSPPSPLIKLGRVLSTWCKSRTEIRGGFLRRLVSWASGETLRSDNPGLADRAREPDERGCARLGDIVLEGEIIVGSETGGGCPSAGGVAACMDKDGAGGLPGRPRGFSAPVFFDGPPLSKTGPFSSGECACPKLSSEIGGP